MWLTAIHIPGKENVLADAESRKSGKETEWTLDRQIFQEAIKKIAVMPQMDLFASRGLFLESPGNISGPVSRPISPRYTLRGFLEFPTIIYPLFSPIICPVIYGRSRTPVKLPGSNILLQHNKMAAGGGLFCAVRRPQRYQERTVLVEMAETEIVERYRLSGERISWLVEQFRGDVERDTTRSCPLAAETQVTLRLRRGLFVSF